MSDAPDVYRAHTHEDLLNTLPTMFGFVPRECVIGISVSGPNCRFGFRLRHDLPPDGRERELAELLAPHLVRSGGDGVFVIALSADAERAKASALALQDAMPPRSCRLVLWADDERVWSDLPGAPPQGEPYRLSDHHPARVHAVAAGQVVLADRADLRAEVVRPCDVREAWLDQAHDRVVEALVRRVLTTDPVEFAAVESREVGQLVDRAMAGERLTDGELVELAVRVSPTPVRDEQWDRIDRENGRQAHALWAAVSRVAAPEVAPAVVSLAGFAAWQWGDGARALVAAERAVELEPDYTMAQLLLQVLQIGLHPDAWASWRGAA